MIPADFDYVRAESADDAIAKLADGGSEAKMIAGGHSLLPLMKLRLAAPTLLIDIARIDELRGIQKNGGATIGPLTTHGMLQLETDLGLFAEAASNIADQQVRNRGTIGGSLAHGDPASDLPAVMLVAEGEIKAKGPDGERTIAAGDMFQGYMTTALSDDEIITEVAVPDLSEFSHGYQKFVRRSEDWAMAGVCVLVKTTGGEVSDVRVGLTNLALTPLRATAVEEALQGKPLDADSIAAAAENAAEGLNPPSDLNATTSYKQHLARVLTKRALSQAAGLDS